MTLKVIPLRTYSIQKKIYNNHQSKTPFEHNTNYNLLSSLNILSNIYKSGISFKSLTFEDTLEENYFKLPKHCQPDQYQIRSAESIFDGNNTFDILPTGNGKTAIGYYAISKNLKEGKRTFYTTPLKALSNQKYADMQKIYGKENVGILTGDKKENSNAPIIVMTTEVYRNMVLQDYFQNTGKLKRLNTVIFDEFHYLGDKGRGKSWEESVMFTPSNVQIIPLSASIGNGEQIKQWLEGIKEKKCNLIELKPSERHVPLKFYSYHVSNGKLIGFDNEPLNIARIKRKFREGTLNDHQVKSLQMLTFGITGNIDNNSIEQVIDEISHIAPAGDITKEDFTDSIKCIYNLDDNLIDTVSDSLYTHRYSKHPKIRQEDYEYERPDMDHYVDLIDQLERKEMIPAIVFIFSKRFSKDLLNYIAPPNSKESMLELTNNDEKQEIAKIIEKHKAKSYLGQINTNALLNGFAVHNAGVLPGQKELVEELFNKKLVKVVFATETLSAGINMPAKTTVISSYEKPDGEGGYRDLTGNEFMQMAGRAGRRGIDTIGNVITVQANEASTAVFNRLVNAGPEDLVSTFNPDYSFIASYYTVNNDDAQLKMLLAKSFKFYSTNNENIKDAVKELHGKFRGKKELLEEKGYLKRNEFGISVTPKGLLVSKIIGYPHIPIIDSITSGLFKGIRPEDLAGIMASCTTPAKLDEDENLKNLSKATPLGRTFNKFREIVNDYNTTCENKEINDFINIDTNTCLLVNKWATLNSKDANSLRNWETIRKDLSGASSIPDEGTFFRAINQTIDLLRQVEDVCDTAIRGNNRDFDKKSYFELKETAKKAINLLCKPPMDATPEL